MSRTQHEKKLDFRYITDIPRLMIIFAISITFISPGEIFILCIGERRGGDGVCLMLVTFSLLMFFSYRRYCFDCFSFGGWGGGENTRWLQALGRDEALGHYQGLYVNEED